MMAMLHDGKMATMVRTMLMAMVIMMVVIKKAMTMRGRCGS